MSEWRIRRRQAACGACERAFEEGERHASLLSIQEGELARHDLCGACWRERGESGADELFWWFTRHRGARRRTLALDIGSIERLFLELEGRQEEKLRELRFLLCLLLMRKKRLRLERVQRARSGEALVVRRPRRREDLVVQVYDFTPERLDELRAQLQEILEGAGEAAEPAAEEAPQAGGAPPDAIVDEDWKEAAARASTALDP